MGKEPKIVHICIEQTPKDSFKGALDSLEYIGNWFEWQGDIKNLKQG